MNLSEEIDRINRDRLSRLEDDYLNPDNAFLYADDEEEEDDPC